MISLDAAAIAPLDPRVREAMLPWLEAFPSNPSSLHQYGQRARAAVDAARLQLAHFLGVQATEVFFTASATESCNWALKGIVEASDQHKPHLIVSSIEHAAVLETARFLERSGRADLSLLPVDEEGKVNPQELADLLHPETKLVSVMRANNEIGTVQPLEELAQLCHQQGVLLHSDACQAVGFEPLDMSTLGLDLLTLNASKIGGPQGAAALIVREGIEIEPLLHGGGQEFGKRAGTEQVAAIVGFAKALELVREQHERAGEIATLRDRLWQDLQHIEGIQLNGSLDQRLPNNLNVFIPGIEGETVVKRMDLEGFAISSGSACASGKVEPSHVIQALGYDEERARSSLRISLSKHSTAGELKSFAESLAKVVSEMRTRIG